MTDITYLLDPWSTLTAIALIKYMPRNVKLAVNNNRIEFFTSTPLDRILRTIMDKFKSGYSRTAILHFRTPITRAIEWYLSPDTAPIFAGAVEGLIVLQNLYRLESDDQSRMVTQLLDGYIRSLQEAIDTAAQRPDPFDQSSDSGESDDEFCDTGEGEVRNPHSTRDVRSMRQLWCGDEVRIVIELFKLLINDPECQTSRVKTIQHMIDSKHGQVLGLVMAHSKHIE